MSKSKENPTKEEIEAFVEAKVDKSKIAFDQRIIDEMIEMQSEGKSKDDILMALAINHAIVPSLQSKYWTESGCSAEYLNYRAETIRLFNSTEGKITQAEWEVAMIDGKFLKKIVNYRQHYTTYYGCWHHIEFFDAVRLIKLQ